jgi:hypothetical protein
MPDHKPTPTPDAIDAAARQLLGDEQRAELFRGTLADALPRYAMTPARIGAFSAELRELMERHHAAGLPWSDLHLGLAGQFVQDVSNHCEQIAGYPPERTAYLVGEASRGSRSLNSAFPALDRFYILAQMLLSLTAGICVANQRARAEQREAGDV